MNNSRASNMSNDYHRGTCDSSHKSDKKNGSASNMQSSNMSNDYQRGNLDSSHQGDMHHSQTMNMQSSILNVPRDRSEGSMQSNWNNSHATNTNIQNSNTDEKSTMRNSSMSNNFNSSKNINAFDSSGSETMHNSFKSNVHYQNELGTSKTNLVDGHQESSVTNGKKMTSINYLPPDWTALVDPDSGETYYANKKTGETTWDRPEQEPNDITSPGSDDHLPANWIALEDAQSGDTYYLNQVTMDTTWERPIASCESQPSSANAASNNYKPTDQLPPGWEAIYDPLCGEYFYANDRGETQWEIPEPDHAGVDDVKSVPQDRVDDDNLPSGWFAVVDENSGETYYCNETTGETTWDIPSDAAAADDDDNEDPRQPYETEDEEGNDDLPPDWYAATDPVSGDTYYCNETTGETTWDLPYLSKGKVAHELSLMSRLSMNENTGV